MLSYFWTTVSLLSASFVADADIPGRADCGVHCVFVALAAYSASSDLSLEKLKVQLQPGDDGNSIAELADAASVYGVHVLPVETTLELLQARERPFAFIAHLKHGHYVLISDASADSVTVIDPPQTRTISQSGFVSQWSGAGLLISPSPLQSEADLSALVWRKRFTRECLKWGAVLLCVSIGYMAVRRVRSKRQVV
jgi:ABC-type bacteriocin/lantibiotic exporter with double-glycine peptidase domain